MEGFQKLALKMGNDSDSDVMGIPEIELWTVSVTDSVVHKHGFVLVPLVGNCFQDINDTFEIHPSVSAKCMKATHVTPFLRF